MVSSSVNRRLSIHVIVLASMRKPAERDDIPATVKGTNKKHLMEYIFRKKSENKRAKQLADQAQARRDKNKEARKRREERQHAKRTELLRKISESERAAAAAEQK
nr:C. briggsae CBR-RPL-19 protein [Haemonchus contortus]